MAKRHNLFLIGEPADYLTDRLPTKGDILRAYFYNMYELNMSIMESLLCTVQQCIEIWTEAEIPVFSLKDCLKKFHLLSVNWEELQSAYYTTSKEQYSLDEFKFLESLDEVFDIGDFEILKKFKIAKYEHKHPDLNVESTKEDIKPVVKVEKMDDVKPIVKCESDDKAANMME